MASGEEKTKIVIVVVILAVLLAGIFILRRKPPQPVSQEKGVTPMVTEEAMEVGEIYLESVSGGNVGPGEDYAVKVKFKAEGKNVFGSDVTVLYDPQYLSADQGSITFGDFFTSYPRVTVDPDNGIIKVTAINGKDMELSTESYDLFTINFRTLEAGKTNLSLNFIKGETNTSTLVERGTSKNILGTVSGIPVTIEE